MDETLPHDGSTHHQGMRGALAGAALRAIDAGLRSLQGLRNRIEPPVVEDDSRGRSRFTAAVDTPPPAAVPHPRSLLRRALTVVAALLLGTGAGTWSAHRGFAELLASREAMIEYQQEEIELAKRQEAIDLKTRAKAQNEVADYRKRLREVQQEIEDRDARIDQLDQQLIAMKRRFEKPAPPPVAAGGRGTVPQKTGNCVAGSTNASGRVLDCIDKFNRP